MKSPAKTFLRMALIAAALLCATVRPAAAATPCWKALLNDWYDGRIDYTDALKHLPPDVATYSSAHDDIERALQSAIAKLGKTKINPNTKIAPPPVPKTTTSLTAVGPGKNKPKPGENSTGGSGVTSTGRKQQGGLSEVANKLDPGSADSLPVPLLVLGGLALVLVAAGGGGLVVKYVRARRPG
jgi:hypothetical protein